MTTAQWIEKYECELLGEYWDNKGDGYCQNRTKAGKYIFRGFEQIINALTNRMEKSDTAADKLVGYGICCLTGIYLVGHALKALF